MVINPTIGVEVAGYIRVIWPNLANGDSGAPIDFVPYADRAVQVAGTFGASGAALVEGSIDGTTYATLSDAAGNEIAFGGAGIKTIMDVPLYVRPRVASGDGTTSLTVSMILRRNV